MIMIYSEKQLDSFSNPPFKYETEQTIKTKDEIQKVLNEKIPSAKIMESFKLDDFKYDIYLQGSYKNSTNVTKSSDVDIVIELTSIYYHDTSLLSEGQKAKFEAQRNPSEYRFNLFKDQVQSSLTSVFGDKIIKRGNKSIKFLENGKYCNADIIPCFTHKKFTFFESYSSSRLNEGIEFFTDAGERIVNFPHQHYEALVKKSKDTSGNFKATVRMYKNLKDELIEKRIIGEGVAKSYFIENLLFNVSDVNFSGTYTERFKKTLNQLVNDFNNGVVQSYVCANGFQKLLSDKTWNIDSMRQFLVGLTKIRDNNEF